MWGAAWSPRASGSRWRATSASAPPARPTGRLTFGDLDPLVDFIRDTPPGEVVAKAVAKLRGGTDLKRLVAAAALANARAFGGEDYVGFHTLMALAPAYQMAQEESDPARKPLAVLKVLHRNASRLHEVGATKEVLAAVHPAKLTPGRSGGEQLRDAARKGDMPGAEAAFAAVCGGDQRDALGELLLEVEDTTEVHRVVLVSRAWDLTRFVGAERAAALLRQSVRYCVSAERNASYRESSAALRELLPKLLDRYKLLGGKPGARAADDAWVSGFADTLFRSDGAGAAEAVAGALAEGFPASAVGEALALAANQLVLRDAGRPKAWVQPGKPEGSVHGDSVGVHCCDTVHAWRNLARVGGRRTQVTGLVLAGYQVGRDRAGRAEFAGWQPYPRGEHAEAVRALPADALLKELDAAVRAKDQARAAAITARVGAERPGESAGVAALLRGYATSEDGALHAEKYYATATDEFAAGREAFRWRHLVALARVTASAYGYAAPAHKEACERLKA